MPFSIRLISAKFTRISFYLLIKSFSMCIQTFDIGKKFEAFFFSMNQIMFDVMILIDGFCENSANKNIYQIYFIKYFHSKFLVWSVYDQTCELVMIQQEAQICSRGNISLNVNGKHDYDG